MADAAEEFLVTQIPEVFVYKIPPQSSSEGHKAADWKGCQIWNGQLKVVTVGESCFIRLLSDDGKLFAQAPVRLDGPSTLTPVIDSSRYFVLRIENTQGKHAYIGIGFRQRGDAFDLNMALQEFQKDVERDLGTKKIDFGPDEDLSLKQGETIKINLKNKGPAAGKSRPEGHTGAPKKLSAPPPPGGSSSGRRGRLAPPPGSGAPHKTASQTKGSSSHPTKEGGSGNLLGSLEDDFGDLQVGGATSSSATTAPSTSAVDSSDNWVAF